MLYHYVYLLLDAGLALATGLVYWYRPDLRRPIIAAGLIGACIEAVSEVWYLQDYWHPQSVLPWPTPEDLLFGFGVTALAVSVVPLVTRRHYSAPCLPSKARYRLSLLLVGYIGTMALAQTITTFNSIWVASTCFLIGGLIGIALRRDLLWPGILAGALMGGFALFSYGVALDFLIDGHAYLSQVYKLAGTRLDFRIFGQVPLDEVIWNLTRGFSMAVMYAVVSGRMLEPVQSYTTTAQSKESAL